jgi:hypothetical protein
MYASQQQYADHRRVRGLPGGSRSAVRHAIETGRLRQSLSRNEAGRVRIDVEAADQEWAATTKAEYVPMAVPGSIARPPPPPLSPPEAAIARAAKKLVEALDQWLGVLTFEACEGAPVYARAAAEALRKRLGRAPTEGELSEALLARELWPFWNEALAGSAFAKMDGVPEADRVEMKRLVGLEAVKEPPAPTPEEVARG